MVVDGFHLRHDMKNRKSGHGRIRCFESVLKIRLTMGAEKTLRQTLWRLFSLFKKNF